LDSQTLAAVGKVAGLGGVVATVLLMIFRDIIRKKIFPMLKVADAYRLLRLITLCTTLVAVVGICGWVVAPHAATIFGSPAVTTTGDVSPVVTRTNGNVSIEIKGK